MWTITGSSEYSLYIRQDYTRTDRQIGECDCLDPSTGTPVRGSQGITRERRPVKSDTTLYNPLSKKSSRRCGVYTYIY